LLSKFEKEGALKAKVPVYGYAHIQLGLGIFSDLQVSGTQLFGGVEYEKLDL